VPSGQPVGGIACGFQLHMRVRDLNELFESPEHEARVDGTIRFDDFAGEKAVTYEIDPQRSVYNYLRIDSATQEAELIYRLYFRDGQQREYLWHGRKYVQKDQASSLEEVLHGYTTLYCH
jgi:hypothetical protein